MKITTITYQAVKNLGNYESERLEMSAQCDEGEDIEAAAMQLRQKVNALLDSPLKMDSDPNEPDVDQIGF